MRVTNESTGAINYGYVTMITTGSNFFPATILGWSHENSGLAITVVTDSSTGQMMSLGALALGTGQLRRRRSSAGA